MSASDTSIMVIEDETLILEAITRKFNSLGVKTISCVTGKQAIQYLSELDELPDAIWIDYYLYDMSGIEFATALKQNAKWSEIPILVVSNSISDEKVNSMLALGLKNYILKTDNRLDEIVEHIIKMVKETKN